MERKTILLVDDDPEDRGIIKDAMELINAGDRIRFAENGVQALTILDSDFQAATLPCLIVLDLNMPKMNGTQTLRHLKDNAHYKDIPVIIYSTSMNSLEKEKCLTLGAHSYVIKPITFTESTQIAHAFLQFCTTQPVV